MTQQGDKGDTGWWDRLYDGAAQDTGPAPTSDSLDERYDSAAATTVSLTGRTPVPAPATAADPPLAPASGSPLDPDSGSASASDAEPVTPPVAEPTSAQPPETTPAPVAEDVPAPALPPALPSAPAPASQATPAPAPRMVPAPRPRTGHIGSRPPTYEPEPTALPAAHPDALGDLVADTVLDGARYGACTLRAASVRGDSARFRGEPRRDALLTARFGQDEAALVFVAVATGDRASAHAPLAAADACRWIGEAVGRSHARLSEDLRSGRGGDLGAGLRRLTDRAYRRLRARAAEHGLAPESYSAHLRCLLLSADPGCRTRVFFGVGPGGLFRLRDGSWQDIEPAAADQADQPYPSHPPHRPDPRRPGPVDAIDAHPDDGTPEPATDTDTEDDHDHDHEDVGDRYTLSLGLAAAPGRPFVEEPPPPPAEPFRFRVCAARPGDTLLLASAGLADPMRGAPALAGELATRWAAADGAEVPGLAAFLADTQLRVTGYADDRTAVAVWEA
ncbi:protein phosphatase 2C domain-containing protein [Streptomyces sp. NPDC046203]|uniref:protein phosphatase 2C domain-containing protein n=1 Tax=Streptomyces sp. NPDC046203 TaxID=3154602 RepID=UPI0033CC3CAD